MWEVEANVNGSKWVLTMKNNPVLLDQCRQWLTIALVGEELNKSDKICSVAVSLRSKVDDVKNVSSIGAGSSLHLATRLIITTAGRQ